MKAARPLVLVLLVCALSLASACADRIPTAPQPTAPSQNLVGSLLRTTGLVSCSDLPYDSTTKEVLIAAGYGTLVRRA